MLFEHGTTFREAGVVARLGKSESATEVRIHGPVIYNSPHKTNISARCSSSANTLKKLLNNVVAFDFDTLDMPGAIINKRLMKNPVKVPLVFNSVTIRRCCRMKHDLIIERGVGVYYKLKNGEKKFVGSHSGTKHPYIVVENNKIYLHTLMLLALCGDAGKIYLADEDLEINHVRIPEDGVTSFETDPRYLELVPSSMNKLHYRFIKRWGLWGVPVSAMAVEELNVMFEIYAQAFGVVLPDGPATTVDYGDSELKPFFISICNELFKKVVNPRYEF